MAAAEAQLGGGEAAGAALADLRRFAPGLSLETVRASYAYANAEPGVFESLRAGLERAGW